jgi:predicted acyltransferase (DUF342 family)
MRLLNLLRCLRRQEGISLVMAVGILGVLSVSSTTLVYYSNSNARSAEFSKQNATAYDLAEAGLNEMVSILNRPENNSLKPTLLPTTVTTYDAGTATWSGTLDQATQTWSLTSTGRIKNPTSATNDVTRTVTAKVPVVPTVTQPLNNPSWNYIFSTRTGTPGGCDMTVYNNVSGASRMYVMGNLCLQNNVNITSSPLVVKGDLVLQNNAAVGSSSSMNTRVETYVGARCQYGGGAWANPCSGNQDSRHIYSKKDPPGYVVGVNTSPILLEPPAADFPTWYTNALPGPTQNCTTQSGSPPIFDNNGVRDNSAGSQELTKSSSYTCRVGPAAATDSTTVAAATNTSQTTIQVASATGFPTVGSFTLRVGNEYMLVTGGHGTTTWTVQRAQQGTTAAAHSIGTSVTHIDPATGELTWNATTNTLTVSGTIFIDGSLTVTRDALMQYNGQATIYLSGTLFFNNNSKLCGGISGSDCDFAAWNPNTEMLSFVANGSGGSAGNGNGIRLANNNKFQGALFATNAIDLANNVHTDGPMVASHVIMNNNVASDSFPFITTVPVGMPGNPTVYAQPNPPQLYSG